MISRLLDLAIRRRVWVAWATLLVVALGAWQLVKLPIDAVPDVTNRQVQINTFVPTLGPLDVEKQITYPIESSLAGIPGLLTTRSLTRNGFSQVTAIFTDATDVYFARQQVTERLTQARDALPDEASPQLAPVTTGLGEIFIYSVAFGHPEGTGAVRRDGHPGWQSDGAYLTPEGERLTTPVARAAYLRTVQDWVIRPRMRTVAGVAGVDSNGGYVKQYVVQPELTALAAQGLGIAELADALAAANLSAGANYVRRAGESYLIRADARLRSIADIEDAVVATRGGVPIRVRDVAGVAIGGAVRTGSGTLLGEEAVIATVLMLTGENTRVVATRVGESLTRIAAQLPPDIVARAVYDRSKLVDATIATVRKNLAEGALLVVVVLFVMLGNLRAALITASVIPITLLMTATGMNALGVSGNLMSLGALDFGLIVDGAVIIVENALRHLAHVPPSARGVNASGERLQRIGDAARAMVQPTVYGQTIIILVFVPILSFGGVEGKTFAPMAITMMLALLSAFVLSVTYVPAMVALWIRGPVTETEIAPLRALKRVYRRGLPTILAHPWPIVGVAVAITLVAAWVFTTIGEEFTPELDEHDVILTAIRIPSTSIEQSTRMQQQIERAIASLPEIAVVFSKTGNADLGTDPMPPNLSDTYVIPKPRDQWPPTVRDKADLLARIEARTSELIGQKWEIQQPIQMRFNELVAGVRADVAIKLYGDDLAAMNETAQRIAGVVREIDGASDVLAAQTDGAPTFDIRIDRQAIGRHGLTAADVAGTIAAALGGQRAGVLFAGDRRHDVVVRLPDAVRDDLEAVGRIPVLLPATGDAPRRSLPLRDLVQFRYTQGLNQISRENGQRMVAVQVNVRDRDLGGFVRDAQQRIATLALPRDTRLEWGGQYENLQSATRRLALVVPVCFALIFGLLYSALGGWRPAALVFTAVPIALAGGVFALALRGIPFSISAAVGFIALSGVAVLNGVVMLTGIQQRLATGEPLAVALVEGAVERVRPVLTTAIVASFGFVPMALATGAGAEVQRPLATVVIGGLMTSTLLTLIVVPAIARRVLSPRRVNADEA